MQIAQPQALRKAIADGPDKNAPVTLEAARAAIERRFPTVQSGGRERSSEFLLREEDSPFNYSLQSIPNGVEFRFHNEFGEAVNRQRFP